MTNEQIERLIQRVVDTVMQQLQNNSQDHKLTGRLIGVETALPKPILLQLNHSLAWVEETHPTDLLVVSDLSIMQLMALANMQANDRKTQMILDAILQKKSVLFFQDKAARQTLKEQTRFGVFKQVNNALQRLETFGLYTIDSENDLETLLKQELLRKNRKKTSKK